MERCRTPHEFVDLVVDGALVEPFDEGVEEEPVRAVNRKYRTCTGRKKRTHYTHMHTSATYSTHHRQ